MTCYVDKLQEWPTVIPCFRKGSCHLIADTLEELHAMAQRIGLRRAWFQSESSCPHYDLTPSKRAKVVKLGAVECSRSVFVHHMRRIRLRVA